MNEKYWDEKLEGLARVFFKMMSGNDDWPSAKAILKQIAHDQREACARGVIDLLEPNHSFDDVEKITEAVRNAEIEGEK